MNFVPYRHISPTAKLVAEMRRHSDIPLAEDIARGIDVDETIREMLGGESLAPDVLQWMAPLSEARYRSLARAIRSVGATQVLEIASGFSFRGAAMTAQDPALRYWETDLPEVHEERVRLRRDLEARGKVAPNARLTFAPLDLMSAGDTDRVGGALDPSRPLTIVNEGLFQYFSMEEKRRAAESIAALLRRFGGVWFTPDFETKDDPMRPHWTHPQFMKIGMFILNSTQRNLAAAAFEDADHVRSFFGELGFAISSRPQIEDAAELTSVARTGSPAEKVDLLRRSRQLWELRLRA